MRNQAAEAHTQAVSQALREELLRLKKELVLPQQEISWDVMLPRDMAEIERRLKRLQILILISNLLLVALIVGLLLLLTPDEKGTPYYVLVPILVLVLTTTPYYVFITLPKEMRRDDWVNNTVHLALTKNTAVVEESGRLFRVQAGDGTALPAFVLPSDADADLRRLCGEVQNRITELSGLPFAAPPQTANTNPFFQAA